ncbi:MAG: hypothetical protein WA579_07995, partial [Rhodomicrobium sp.]
MLPLRELTLAHGRNRCGAAVKVASGSVFFFIIFIKWLGGVEISLTCRKGEFAEDVSEEGIRRKRQEQVDKQM